MELEVQRNGCLAQGYNTKSAAGHRVTVTDNIVWKGTLSAVDNSLVGWDVVGGM